MPKALLPRDELKRIIRRRKTTGAFQWDEVWNGVYVMSPLPDVEHQGISGQLVAALLQAVGHLEGVQIYPGLNISDRETHWRRNFRCPDASVFFPGNPAENRGAYWLGGPDFAVEILSPGDRARQKLRFYAKVGVRELLFIDRRPWSLELRRREGQEWSTAGTSTPDDNAAIPSAVLPLTFRLLSGEPRPQLELVRDDGERWVI